MRQRQRRIDTRPRQKRRPRWTVDGIAMNDDAVIRAAYEYGGGRNGSVDDAVRILRAWNYRVVDLHEKERRR